MSSSGLSTRFPPSSQGDLILTIYVCGEKPEDLRNFIPIHIFNASIADLERSVRRFVNNEFPVIFVGSRLILEIQDSTMHHMNGCGFIHAVSGNCNILYFSFANIFDNCDEETIRSAAEFAEDWQKFIDKEVPQALSIRRKATMRISNMAQSNSKPAVSNKKISSKVATGASKKVSLNTILSKFKNWGAISLVWEEQTHCDTSDESIVVIEDMTPVDKRLEDVGTKRARSKRQPKSVYSTASTATN